MKTFALGIAMTVAACSAAAFEINLSSEERSKYSGKLHLQDLLVGDAMRIRKDQTCSKGNQLYVYGLAEPTDEAKWSSTFKAEIKPGRMASLTIEPPEEPTRSKMAIQVIACEAFELGLGASPDQFLAVSEINGFKDLASLYKSDLFQSPPFK